MASSSSDVTLPKPPTRECAVCQQPYRLGELWCLSCGHSFTSAGKTGKIDLAGAIDSDNRSWSLRLENPLDITIILEIDGKIVELPNETSLVIGRVSRINPHMQKPDVDLSGFDAEENGVSRQHLRISRDPLIFIADLGSTNGTYLNGQRLFINSDCPLSDGDELRIGRLRAKVRFIHQNQPITEDGKESSRIAAVG